MFLSKASKTPSTRQPEHIGASATGEHAFDGTGGTRGVVIIPGASKELTQPVIRAAIKAQLAPFEEALKHSGAPPVQFSLILPASQAAVGIMLGYGDFWANACTTLVQSEFPNHELTVTATPKEAQGALIVCLTVGKS